MSASLQLGVSDLWRFGLGDGVRRLVCGGWRNLDFVLVIWLQQQQSILNYGLEKLLFRWAGFFRVGQVGLVWLPLVGVPER